MFTGNKDVDKMILENIPDEKSFLSLCLTNKYLYNLCDEDMFRKRIMRKYKAALFYHKNESYKKFYLKLMYFIDKLKEEYNFDFNEGNPIAYYYLMRERLAAFYRIREAIQLRYTDLAIFLSEKEKPIDERMLKGLFALSAQMGNKILVDYYLKMGNFSKSEYEIVSRRAELTGHFEMAKYLRTL